MASSGILVSLAIVCTVLVDTTLGKSTTLYGDAKFWREAGHKDVSSAEADDVLYNGKAKNVIIFVGDGMDITTQTLASYLKTNGEQHRKQSLLFFQQFGHFGLSSTYSVDKFTSDSAASATAMFTGVKTRSGVVGYDGTIVRGNCASTVGKEKLKSIFREAKEAKRSVGVVTTDSLAGATTAAAYGNSPDRRWMTAEKITSQHQRQCKDIAIQLYENAKDFDVVFGGGRSSFYTNSQGGNRSDQDIVPLWTSYQQNQNRNYQFVSNKAEFSKIDPISTDYAFGLFAPEKMAYQLDLDTNSQLRDSEPSLTEMVKKAHAILSKNKNGYFLLVEGAGIDHANHDNMAKYAANEVAEMDRAVKYIKENTKPEETLIIVTADHGHTTSFGNYMPRGSDVFGFVKDDSNSNIKSFDGSWYTAIGYGAGTVGRSNTKYLTEEAMKKNNYVYQSLIPAKDGSHGGSPVATYADGVKAHLFTTLHEQNFIYYVMKRAACLGEFSSRPGC